MDGVDLRGLEACLHNDVEVVWGIIEQEFKVAGNLMDKDAKVVGECLQHEVLGHSSNKQLELTRTGAETSSFDFLWPGLKSSVSCFLNVLRKNKRSSLGV